MNITIADFFAGIGGIRLGFQLASPDFKCVFTNDLDQSARETYSTNFPGEICPDNISDIDPSLLPDFDIFLGGFPCQPFSIAGKQKGFQDSRGNVFFDIINILKIKRPKAILLENVKNLTTHDNGNTMKVISRSLTEIGYSFQYKLLNSCKHANIPQNRERIFIVGFLDKKMTEIFRFPSEMKLTSKVSDFFEEKVDKKYYYSESSKIFPKLKETVTSPNVYQYRRYYVRENKSNLCPTLTANMGTGGHNIPIILDKKGIRKLTPRECISLQGFPKTYILPDISSSQLYKQAGNSVTVPLIKRIAKNILYALKMIDRKGDKGNIVISSSDIVGYDPDKKSIIIIK